MQNKKLASLDIESVKAFIAIVDLQSFTRAADALGTTQGALSVKLKRLENRLNQQLVERTPRHVRLSPHGELFITPARDFLEAHNRAMQSLSGTHRKIKLGIACHVMGPEVHVLLSKINSQDPSVRIELSLDTPKSLLESYRQGTLDVIIIRDEEGKGEGAVLCNDHFRWYATSDFEYSAKEPLRLASLSPLCGVRDLAAQELRNASIDYTESFVGGGVQAVIAAISAGLAIGVLPQRVAPLEFIDAGIKFSLPNLPSSPIVIHSGLSDRKERIILDAIRYSFRDKND